MTASLRVGVDLGGTKIEAVAMTPGGDVLIRRRIASPREDYDATVAMVRDLARAVSAEAGAERARVGVGVPGSISPRTGLLRNANSTWLNGRRFRDDLAEAIGWPLRMANDANCLAASEAADGAGAGAETVFGVIIGTGTGGGVARGGVVVEGANGVSGEWGHARLPAAERDELPGPACWCGRRGCVETWLSGPAFAADFARAGGDAAMTAADIAAAAAAGEATAVAALDRYVARLGRGLSMIVNILDPDVIVLGGGMSNIAGLPERAAAAMTPHVFSDHVATRVARAAHGDSSGVRGACWLWPAEGE